MIYKLCRDSNQGLVVDATPIMSDILETFELQIIPPDEGGSYIALFKGEDYVEQKAVVKNGKITVPQALLDKERRVGLIICKIEGGSIVKSWECTPFQITAFLHMRKSQRQITPCIDDGFFYQRFTQLEEAHARYLAQFKHLKSSTEQFTAEVLAELEETQRLLRAQSDRFDSVEKGLKATASQVKDNAEAFHKLLEEFEESKKPL